MERQAHMPIMWGCHYGLLPLRSLLQQGQTWPALEALCRPMSHSVAGQGKGGGMTLGKFTIGGKALSSGWGERVDAALRAALGEPMPLLVRQWQQHKLKLSFKWQEWWVLVGKNSPLFPIPNPEKVYYASFKITVFCFPWFTFSGIRKNVAVRRHTADISNATCGQK